MNGKRTTRISALLLALSMGIAAATEQIEEEAYEVEPFSVAELDQMLAPIALYPDVLLTQVLMAATYPLEVVEASRWSRAHPELSGEAAERAVEDRDWDQSVKYLVGFPDLIQRMDEDLGWTRRLGDAFLLQEDEVMARTQALRRRSLEEGSLDQMAHIRIEEEAETIVLQPRNVTVIHVPYYSSEVVYGDWWWYDYPPYYWEPPLVHYGRAGICWSRGIRVSTSFYFSAFDWHLGHIVIRSRHPGYRYYDFDWYRRDNRHGHERNIWRHDTSHRRGVAYRDYGHNERYGRKDVRKQDRRHEDWRGEYRRQDTRPGTRTPPAWDERVVRPRRDEPSRNDRLVRTHNRPQPAEPKDRFAGRQSGRERDGHIKPERQRTQRPPKTDQQPKQKRPVVQRQDREKGKDKATRPEPLRPARRNDVVLNERRDNRQTTSRKEQGRPRDP